MNIQRDPDAILASWLEDGPTRLPDGTRRAIGVATRSTDQRRRPFWVSWRLPNMNSYARLAVAAVVVVAVGAFGVALLRPNGSTGPGGVVLPNGTSLPTSTGAPTPSPSPIPLTDTSNWVTFTSSRYGYTIGYPPSWTATPGSRDWTMADRTDWVSPAQDEFIDKSAAYEIGVHGFAADIPTGTTADQWIDMYSRGSSPQCVIQPSVLPAVSVGGHAGKFADQPTCDDSIAFVPIGSRMHVFTIGRAQQIPLLNAFLSTVRFQAASAPSNGPSAIPSATGDVVVAPEASGMASLGWSTYRSQLYGFTIGYPPGLTPEPADHPWSYGADATYGTNAAQERFSGPPDGTRLGFSVWSVPLDPGTTFDDPSQIASWAQSYCQATGDSPCAGTAIRGVPLCLERRDCHPGLLVPFDNDVMAFFTAGIYPSDRMIVVAVWNNESDPKSAPYGGTRHYLESILSTMGVWPADTPLEQRTVRDVPVPTTG